MNSVFRKMLWLGIFVLSAAVVPLSAEETKAVSSDPPAIQREFRAAWVSTVTNIDWPSKPGISTEQQKAEAIAILDKAQELHLNALVFQVRPHADAMYKSAIEPWSEYLTGEQGKAPEPFYDPLEFWCTEAHKRGIELHAWF
ncbi:MAG: family 10 glycosylhydrolase, partial [Candidatus Sumerlaeota bacterium]